MKEKLDQPLSDEEIARRRDELAKRMLDTPPQPLKPRSKNSKKAKPSKKCEQSTK
jgi:hypothetical protein